MNKEMDESQKRLRSLLRQLFQFDFSDLDHGIYRIMNQRREEIEKFIDKDLFQKTDEAFQEYLGTSAESLQKEVEELKSEINASFGAGTIDEHGEIKSYHDTPKVRKYAEKQEELRSAKLTRGQIEDVYNHVYEFFSRYFDKGDFISKRRFGGKDKYVIPYNGEEVMFHWANKDHYYVKTTEYFNNLEFKIGEWKVEFILTQAELEQNNVKGDNRYFVLADEEKISLDEKEKKLSVYFQYKVIGKEEKKELGKGDIQKTIIEKIEKKILSRVKDKGIEKHLTKKEEDKTLLARQLNMYVDKHTSDYFIHKNLKAFLQGELDFYIKNEVLHLDEIAGKGKDLVDERKIRLNIARIKAIRDISESIIEFLAQIEDFQKMLFEKKKLVLRADYCMTLDMVPKEFYSEIAQNKEQVAEWKNILNLDEYTKGKLHKSGGKDVLDTTFLEAYPHLILDTMFFSQDFQDRLLEHTDNENLDERISGLLIKSENLQALNLLTNKYNKQINAIYIDPPYNTGSDEFIYKDNFQHSSWASMMWDRLTLAQSIMSEPSCIWINIDDNEVHNLKHILNSIFQNRFCGNIAWKKTSGDNKPIFAFTHDNLLIYGEPIRSVLTAPQRKSYKNPDNDPRGPWASGDYRSKWSKHERPNLYYPIIHPVTKEEIYPDTNTDSLRVWGCSPETHLKNVEDNLVWWGENSESKEPKKKRFLSEHKGINLRSVWTDAGTNDEASKMLQDLFGGESKVYSTPKPTKLIEKLIPYSFYDKGIILDFFAGSGTTGHAVLNLNAEDEGDRKYIMVEMGDYFDTVMKPRIQKVMFSKEWKDGVPQSNEGHSHMCKYMYLEQYEDTLYNIVFRAKDKTFQETLETFDDYFVRYMLEYETRESATRLATADFENPFDYKIKKVSGSGWEIEPVDLVETFNYLLGLDVEQIKTAKDGERYYRCVKGRKQNGNTTVIVWRSTKNIDLKKDKEFIEDKFLSEETPEQIYVSGMCHVANAKPIEPEFKRLMGA
jgi:adenine-specific DNA-methyltransferase